MIFNLSFTNRLKYLKIKMSLTSLITKHLAKNIDYYSKVMFKTHIKNKYKIRLVMNFIKIVKVLFKSITANK